MRRPKVIIAKPGLDGHTRGAKMVCLALRDAGIEVVYTGTRCTPEELVSAAIQEDTDVIGLSILSGAHMEIFANVMRLLKEKGLSDIIVIGGGVIPEDDADKLKLMGVADIFMPGSRLDDIARTVSALVEARRKQD